MRDDRLAYFAFNFIVRVYRMRAAKRLNDLFFPQIIYKHPLFSISQCASASMTVCPITASPRASSCSRSSESAAAFSDKELGFSQPDPLFLFVLSLPGIL